MYIAAVAIVVGILDRGRVQGVAESFSGRPVAEGSGLCFWRGLTRAGIGRASDQEERGRGRGGEMYAAPGFVRGCTGQAMDDPRDAERCNCAPDLRPSETFEFPSCSDAALAALHTCCSALCRASTSSVLRSLDAKHATTEESVNTEAHGIETIQQALSGRQLTCTWSPGAWSWTSCGVRRWTFPQSTSARPRRRRRPTGCRFRCFHS